MIDGDHFILVFLFVFKLRDILLEAFKSKSDRKAGRSA